MTLMVILISQSEQQIVGDEHSRAPTQHSLIVEDSSWILDPTTVEQLVTTPAETVKTTTRGRTRKRQKKQLAKDKKHKEDENQIVSFLYDDTTSSPKKGSFKLYKERTWVKYQTVR